MTDKEPFAHWFGDECADISCGCGNRFIINIGKFKKCGRCGREFTFEQSQDIIEKGKEPEPLYSVSEIEKIFDAMVGKRKSYEWDTAYFVEFLKDKKKVEEILNGSKRT